MTRDELMQCAMADIKVHNTDSLVEIKQVQIDTSLPIPLRMAQYLNQVQNPYLFRIDDLIVKVSFSGTRDLSSAITGLLIQS